MPIYEFLCRDCGEVNEAIQKTTDPPPGRCEKCGGKRLSKLMSRSAFQLKGSGWYADLYSSSKKDSAGPAPADGAASPSASGTSPDGGGSGGASTVGSSGDKTPSSGTSAGPSAPAPSAAPPKPAAKGGSAGSGSSR